MTVGGDGTILYASKIFAFSECPPLVCFSMGSLGYLCNFKVNDYKVIFDSVLRYATYEEDKEDSQESL